MAIATSLMQSSDRVNWLGEQKMLYYMGRVTKFITQSTASDRFDSIPKAVSVTCINQRSGGYRFSFRVCFSFDEALWESVDIDAKKSVFHSVFCDRHFTYVK